MGQCFLYGNSGASVGTAGGINFSVKKYATVDTLLTATPQENTIGIVSSTAISNYYFCVGQPGLAYEDVDMMSNVTLANGYISAGVNDGAVWIKTMSDSVVSFNAIKKNMLEVYPTAVSQYVSGAWETCVAYIYQSGAWKQFWNGELFENGNLYSDHTGGWPVTMGVQQSTDPYLYYNAGAQNLIFGTAKKIDVTNFSSLHVIGRGRGDYAYQGGVSARTPSFGIASALSSSGSGGVTYAARADLSVGYVGISTLPSFTTESVLDLTSYSGEYYIAFSVTGSHTNAEIAIKKVWLE